jgi:BON domain
MTRTDLLSGMVVGASLMFLMDPSQGRRRRALARDQMARGLRRSRRYLRAAGRDISNRVSGTAATLNRAHDSAPIDDDLLAARVRSAFGRMVSHSGAVHTGVTDGVVRLDGVVLASELASLLAAIRDVDGVRAIDNRLQVRMQAEDVPGLQGAGTPPRRSVRRLLRAPGVQVTAFVSGVLTAGCVALTWSRR